MKKNFFLQALSFTLLLTACDYNDQFEGLEQQVIPTDKLNLSTTLTPDDYVAIASNPQNIKLAGKEKKAALDALKTNCYFTEQITPEEYLPAYFATLYPGADDLSAIQVTYQKTTETPAAAAINHAAAYTLTPTDYLHIWGEAYPFIAPSHPIDAAVPALLADAFPAAIKDQAVYVYHNVSEAEPAGATYAFDAGFEDLWHQAISKVALPNWTNIALSGSNQWDLKAFKGNNYLQASAANSNSTMDVYMITPEIEIKSGMELTFDACYGNYQAEGGRIQVLLTTGLKNTPITDKEIAAASWDDLTSNVNIPIPSGKYGTLANVCHCDLSAYAGQTIRIAIRYIGDNSEQETVTHQATTTVQVDNISIHTTGHPTDKYGVAAIPYQFDGTDWKPFTQGITVTAQEMAAMGSRNDFFLAPMDPRHYLPLLLQHRYDYPTPNQVVTVLYKQYNKSGSFHADDFHFDGQNWIYDGVKTETSQYVKNGGKWLYNPNVTIELLPVRGNANSILYYQAICDWVGANKGKEYYQTGYTNAEYYYGASAYLCCIDFKIDSWRSKCAADYKSYSDDALKELQVQRLKEAFLPALEKLHAEAQPTAGLEVLYIINFGLSTGGNLSACNATITYKVIGKGKFEYVSHTID
ncbi:MAG: choice-of-anchor J domain-containing protein [Alistipes sp.]